MSWAKTAIKNICMGIYDGPHATPPVARDGTIFLGISNITPDGHLDLSNSKYISEEDFSKWTKRVIPQAGDIVFSYEATLNRYAIIPEGFRGCLGRRMALIRPDEEKVLGKFLYYYFFSDEWRGTIAENTVIGATVDRIPLIRFPDFPVSFPIPEKQRAIAIILSTYDNLIENNQEQIKLLEEAAQRLYKEWFVDLRFPGYETTPVVDGVPEGWKNTTLENICALNKRVLAQTDIPPNIPYIGLEHMPRKDICLCEWGTSSEVLSSKFLYQEKDIIFGKIRPYFHKVGFALNSGIASTDSIIMRANEGVWGLLLMTVSSVAFVGYVSKTCKEGSKMPRADWNQMKAYPVLIPEERTREKFESNVSLIADRIKVLALQNRGLSEARARLLPKLMGGEIEV